MKFFQIFDLIEKGNFALTDEAIYKSIKHGGILLPVFGGTEEHIFTERWVSENGFTNEDKKIRKFQGEGIILSLDGSAGNMTYTKDRSFALNHHAGFLTLKSDVAKIVDLEFFSLFYENQLREAAVSEGSKTLTTSILKELEFDIPEIGVQKEIMDGIRPILKEKESLQGCLFELSAMKERILSVDYSNYQQRNIPISDVLIVHSGNSGLTEQEVYQHIMENGEEYIILSGATTDEKQMGWTTRFHLKGNLLKVIDGKAGIGVIRKGKAGTIVYKSIGKYTLTDDAYFLTVNPDCFWSVNLKWLMIQYRQLFFDFVSSSDNATWNKDGFFKQVRIDIPLEHEQLNVLCIYDRLEILERSIIDILSKIDNLFSKQISV